MPAFDVETMMKNDKIFFHKLNMEIDLKIFFVYNQIESLKTQPFKSGLFNSLRYGMTTDNKNLFQRVLPLPLEGDHQKKE